MPSLLTDTLAKHAVYTDLSANGLIAVQGADTVAFLQGQFTNDVRKLAQQRAQYSGLCSPKGRLIASFLLWKRAEVVYLQVPMELQAFLLKRLSMYVLRSKVQLQEASQQWRRVGIAGVQAAAVVELLTGVVPDTDMSTRATEIASVIRFSEQRYLVSLPEESADDTLQQLPSLAENISAAQWQWVEIQAGIPVIVTATQDQFVPQMVNFDLTDSVDFQKGCYTGQEIVARTQYLGRLKKRMYLVHGEGEMAAGDEIYTADMDGQATGMIVNSQLGPAGGWDALAVVQIASAQSQPLHLKSMEGPLLSLKDLPYKLE